MSYQSIIEALKGGPGSGNFDHKGIPGKVGGSAPSGGRGGAVLIGKGSYQNASFAASDRIKDVVALGWHNANHKDVWDGEDYNKSTIYASYRLPNSKYVGLAMDVDNKGNLFNITAGNVGPNTTSGKVDNPIPLNHIPYPEEVARIVKGE